MKLQSPHNVSTLKIYSVNTETSIYLPLTGSRITAGFPSPADDFLDSSIDLNEELIKNKASTFYGRVRGESMKDVGINDGDLLIIDKSIEPQNNKIAVCFIDGEFTVKRINFDKDTCWLVAENKDFEPIKVTKNNNFIVWGIVIHIIKSF